MIKFHDPSGAPHFGQATITRTTSVNGGLSLTGEVFAGGDVLNGLDYGWWLNFDNEKYVITYKKLSDDTNTVVFDAVQQFFWDFAKVALHAQYTGSHEYTFYLGQLFDKSGYTYKNDITVPAFEKENWGYKNKLDLFNDIIDQAGVEFEVHNETVHIAKQIGSDLTSFARKGINLSDLTEEMKISDFATYAKGYGAFKDAENQSKGRLEVEYRSELAKQFGDLEMDPIVDERYTIADNLIAALKKQVDATYTVSMTMNIYDLENAGYPNYEAPKVGDWILAIDEALNFKRKIRIIQLEEQFDVTGKRIGYTATCGDLNIVDQYTHLQISLDSKVQRIQETVDAAATSANGKNTNYYGAKEPVSANEGDLWFDQSNSDPDKWSIKQWVNGRWEQITLNPGEIDAKVDVAKQEAETAVENAKSASDKADQLASKYDDTNSLASQAMGKAISAQGDASSAVAAANSTASEFGRVDQKADSAVASALNAQSNASDAVKQASSAAADSKDAKQIAGAVSQSYKTLTDGSTMTIAELESGLAVKLTKSDLDGYATQTWAQNQIQTTADGINGTMSSIKSTVDGQTTSINDLKADSSSFKSQFTTVNNTLGKQSTDIGILQATSKELTTGFNTLTTDNGTNKQNISQLSQTVDGMKADISKKIEQKDLDGYATQTWAHNQIKITADGINGTISSVKSTVDGHTTSINDLKTDSSGFKAQFQTVNNTLGEHTTDISTLQASATSLSASFNSLSSDNTTNKNNISQLQASATAFNSTLLTVQQQVQNSAVGTNLYRDTRDFDNPNGIWNRYSSWTKTGEIYNGMTAVSTTKDWDGLSQTWAVKKGETYTFSIYAKYESGTGNSNLYCRGIDNLNTTNTDIGSKTISLNGTWQRVFITFVVTADGYVCPRLERTTDNTNKLIVAGPKLERGSIMTDYSTSPLDNATVTAVSSISQTIDSIQTTVRGKVDNDTYQTDIKQLSGQITSVAKKADDSWTEIQQNSSNIDLKVSKDGIVNAINMSPETTSIFGKKLFITAETYIADAIIENSMIDNINAEKITAGTLNAAKVNVINLNATSITTGTLSGSNLSLNLNTGVVTFQRGRIHNASDSIDINIDAGYMSVANGSNRAMLKNGEMQFVEPGTYDTSTNPYLRISNTFGGQSTEGAAFIGRKYAALTNSDNLTGSGIFDIGMGTETFSGIATGYGSGFLNKGWHMTKVGGAERGVVISGGKSTSYNPSWSASPSIMVGATNTNNSSGGMHGSNIIMECDYLFNYSTWRRTSSHAANVYVADDGAIVRASSASKYKTNIERSFETEMGERILEVPTAHWFDKAEVRNKTLNPQAPDPRRYFGMIADDLDDAGLTELVEYNDKGEVEGLMYDRIALTIIPIVRNYRDRITKLESEIKQLKEG